ncbi:MAG: tetratricopeptide repeat protein [Candidatus Omnitrophica bacterium]|nr:tetratricopeptide repeat protein [Candidatus Omnitrophota bacterium]
MVIPLAIAKTFIDSKNIRGILWGFASCLMLSQLFLTYSRAGIISFSMSFLMCIVLLSVLGMRKEKRYKRHFFIILVCLAITLLMVASALKITTNHMNNTLQTDLSTRLQLYKDIFRLIQRFPIFGVGLGNFQTVFPIYQSFAYRSIFIYAHNDYLQLFSELGIFGFIIVFCGGFYFFKGVLSAILESYNRNPESDRYVVSLLFGCLAGFLSISFHSLLDFNMQIPANALLFTIIISITLKLIIKEHGEVEDKNDYKVTKALIGRNRIIAYFSFPALMIYALFPIRVFLTNTFAEKIKEETKPISVSIDLEKPLHLSSGNSELYYHLADLYEASGDKHTAIRNYMRSIKLNPLNSKYHFRLGLISGVQRDFERATLLNPAGEDIYYETGVFYLKGHQPIKGAEQFKKALSLSTHYEEAIFDQIWGSSAVFDHDKYKVMAEVIPDSPEAKAKLARYLKDKQLWDESEREYRVAIDMANGKEKLRYMADFAHNFLMRGRRRFGDAKEIWLKYIALNDTNIHAFFNLGRCYEYEGELDKAAEFYAYAIQMAPERVYYDKLAQVLFRKGDYEGAIETWQECIKISPNFSPAYYGIGESYNKLEQFNRALFYYQETLRLKPDGKDILQKIESIR